MRHILLLGMMLLASACGEQSGTLGVALGQVRGLFAGGDGDESGFTATRASLIDAGITAPVLVARLQQSGISAGLLQYQHNRGVTVWRSLDGALISTEDGVLLSTRGFGTDLHSIETSPLLDAFSRGDGAQYSRLFRMLDGESQIGEIRLYCRLELQGSEPVNVLGRIYNTHRVQEVCQTEEGGAPVFENTYWRDSAGTIWRSRQWAGPELGYADLENVIN